MDLDLKIYVRMRRRGGAPWASVGRSFRVISGASGGIRGLSGASGGIRGLSCGFPEGTNREGAFVGAVNRTACSSKASKG